MSRFASASSALDSKRTSQCNGLRHGASTRRRLRALPEGQVQLVACCDLYRDRADAFAGLYGVPATAIYTDYHAMLAKERLDIVSVATWPDVHSRLVIDTAKYRPKGIFCEKPMANTWGECKKMVAACTNAA